jgi:hypothetical protein
MNKTILFLCLGAAIASSSSCSIITAPYHVAKDVVEGGVRFVKAPYEENSILRSQRKDLFLMFDPLELKTRDIILNRYVRKAIQYK